MGTADQEARWTAIRKFFLGTVTTRIKGARDLALCCSAAAEFAAVEAGVSGRWGAGDDRRVAALLERFNVLDRIVAGADIGKYALVDVGGGDIAICSPPGTNQEQARGDIYLGALFVPVLVGIVLCGAIWVALKKLDTDALQTQKDFAAKLIAGDKEVLASGSASLIKTWGEWKKNNAGLLKSAQANSPGLIDRIFGSGAGSSAGIALLGLLGLLAWSKYGGRSAASERV